MLLRTLGAADVGFAAPLLQGARACLDTTLSPQDRMARFDTAAKGVPEALTGLLERVASVTKPEDLFGLTGAGIGEENAAPSTEWWGGLVTKLPDLAKELDKLLLAPRSEASQKKIKKAAAYVRAAGATESENLSKLALHIPPEQLDRIQGAVIDYSLGLTTLLMRALPDPDEASESPLDPSAQEEGVSAVKALLKPDPARATEEDLNGAVELVADLAAFAPQGFQAYQQLSVDGMKEVERLNEELKKAVGSAIPMSEEAAAVLKEITEDAKAGVRFGIHLAQFMAILDRTDIKPTEETVVQLQRAAEGMGIPFVKMLQSIVNDNSLRKEVSQDEAMDGVLFEVMTRLQEGVTPMSDEDLRAQLKLAFPDSTDPDFKDVFVEFNFTSFRAGSFGQVHEAWIRDPANARRLIKVAVKVQRPNMEQSLAEAVRVLGIVFRGWHGYGEAMQELDPLVAGKLHQKSRFFEALFVAFVKSFKIELNYPHEVKNIERKRKDARTHSEVFIHRPFKSHSNGPVLTTEFVEGWGLNDLLDLHHEAHEARALPMPKTSLGPEEDARWRAEHWCLQSYGKRPSECKVELEPGQGGYLVTAHFPDPDPVVKLRISNGGEVTSDATRTDMNALSRLLREAREANKEWLSKYPLDEHSEQEARDRAELWCRRHHGMRPTQLERESGETGWVFTAHFRDGSAVKVQIDDSGKTTGEERQPTIDAFKKIVEVADAALAIPLPATALGAEQDASWRATRWCQQTYGMRPVELKLEPDQTGYAVTARFNDPVYPLVELHVANNGDIDSEQRPPDLSPDALQQVLATLTSDFLSDLLWRRRPHGDMTKGNFRVLPNGRTVAILDFGQVLILRVRHFFAPAKVMIGALMKSKKMIASAIIDMSEQAGQLKGQARKKVRDHLVEMLEKAEKKRIDSGVELLPGLDSDGKLAQIQKLVVAALTDSLAVMMDSDAGLVPTPIFIHLFRTSFLCMLGNINSLRLALAEQDQKVDVRVLAKALFKTFMNDVAISWTPLAKGREAKKRKRVVKMGGITSWEEEEAA